MSRTVELLALSQAFHVCATHDDALRGALDDVGQLQLTPDALDDLNKEERRILDQFAYRYTRLQDDMGSRLIPAVLRALGEEIAALPMLDRLDRLEQLGWLESAEEWAELRRIRNEFTHEYPEAADKRLEKLELARSSAGRLSKIFGRFAERIDRRWGEL